MNFKLLFLLFFVSACGVKGDPASPKSPALPSLMNNYPDIETGDSINEHQRRKR